MDMGESAFQVAFAGDAIEVCASAFDVIDVQHGTTSRHLPDVPLHKPGKVFFSVSGLGLDG